MSANSARDPKTPLHEVNFLCITCRHSFACEPEEVVDAPERSHAWEYYATCPNCDAQAGQAPWEKALMSSYGKHTGPKTAEGKLAVTQNIAGHPTPEEAQRTRFNAMKHGLYADVAKFFPARPGKYPHCEGCAYFIDCGVRSDHCLRRVEPFMRFQMAAESDDPSLIKGLLANNQAAWQAIVEDMILAIAQDGVRFKNPKMYYDKDGGCHVFEYTDEKTGEKIIPQEIFANPLLGKLIDFMSKNNTTLEDMALTPKTQRDDETLKGNLDTEQQNAETLEQYQRRQTEAMEGMRVLIERSQSKVKADPILIEHNVGDGDVS